MPVAPPPPQLQAWLAEGSQRSGILRASPVKPYLTIKTKDFMDNKLTDQLFLNHFEELPTAKERPSVKSTTIPKPAKTSLNRSALQNFGERIRRSRHREWNAMNLKEKAQEVFTLIAGLDGNVNEISKASLATVHGDDTRFFRDLDSDADGVIKLSEWILFMFPPELESAQSKYASSIHELKSLFSSMDIDGNHKLSYKAWNKGITKHQGLLTKYFGGSAKELGGVFRRLDADRDGSLTWDEFLHGTKLSQKISKMEAPIEALVSNLRTHVLKPAVKGPSQDELDRLKKKLKSEKKKVAREKAQAEEAVTVAQNKLKQVADDAEKEKKRMEVEKGAIAEMVAEKELECERVEEELERERQAKVEIERRNNEERATIEIKMAVSEAAAEEERVQLEENARKEKVRLGMEAAEDRFRLEQEKAAVEAAAVKEKAEVEAAAARKQATIEAAAAKQKMIIEAAAEDAAQKAAEEIARLKQEMELMKVNHGMRQSKAEIEIAKVAEEKKMIENAHVVARSKSETQASEMAAEAHAKMQQLVTEAALEKEILLESSKQQVLLAQAEAEAKAERAIVLAKKKAEADAYHSYQGSVQQQAQDVEKVVFNEAKAKAREDIEAEIVLSKVDKYKKARDLNEKMVQHQNHLEEVRHLNEVRQIETFQKAESIKRERRLRQERGMRGSKSGGVVELDSVHTQEAAEEIARLKQEMELMKVNHGMRQSKADIEIAKIAEEKKTIEDAHEVLQLESNKSEILLLEAQAETEKLSNELRQEKQMPNIPANASAVWLEELKSVFDSMPKDEDGNVSYKVWMRSINKHQAVLIKFFGGETAADVGKQFKVLAQRGAKTLSWSDFVAGATFATRERERRQAATELGN